MDTAFCVHNPTVYCLHQIAWSHLAWWWRRKLVRMGNSICSSKRFLYISITLSHNPHDSAVYLKQFNFWQKEILIKQNLTLTEAIPLQQPIYFYLQQSKCFWNRYNIALLWQPEPSSDKMVLTRAVCSVRELRYKVIWSAHWHSTWLNMFHIQALENISTCIIQN